MSGKRKRTINVREYGYSGSTHSGINYDATITIVQTPEKPEVVLHLRLFEIADLVNTLREAAKGIKRDVDRELRAIGDETE